MTRMIPLAEWSARLKTIRDRAVAEGCYCEGTLGSHQHFCAPCGRGGCWFGHTMADWAQQHRWHCPALACQVSAQLAPPREDQRWDR